MRREISASSSTTKMVFVTALVYPAKSWRARSSTLQDHRFEHVGSVFGFIGRNLKHLDQLLHFYEVDGIFFAFEEGSQGGTADVIGFVLQSVDLDANIKHIVMLFQLLNS